MYPQVSLMMNLVLRKALVGASQVLVPGHQEKQYVLVSISLVYRHVWIVQEGARRLRMKHSSMRGGSGGELAAMALKNSRSSQRRSLISADGIEIHREESVISGSSYDIANPNLNSLLYINIF